MAEKRMFSNKIVSSDSFKEMPLSTQALYFHLGMNADDEGFLNNAKSVQRSILATEDDMKLLIAKNFIIPMESGVIVIKHWKMNNTIPPSKLRLTQYTDEKRMLTIKENGAYTVNFNNCRQIADDCLPNVCQVSAQSSIEESSIVQSRVVESRGDALSPLTPEELSELIKEYGDIANVKAEKAKEYKNCYNYSTIKQWCEEDKGKGKPKKGKKPEYTQHEYSKEYFKSLINNKGV